MTLVRVISDAATALLQCIMAGLKGGERKKLELSQDQTKVVNVKCRQKPKRRELLQRPNKHLEGCCPRKIKIDLMRLGFKVDGETGPSLYFYSILDLRWHCAALPVQPQGSVAFIGKSHRPTWRRFSLADSFEQNTSVVASPGSLFPSHVPIAHPPTPESPPNHVISSPESFVHFGVVASIP
jgi:hypothetical protein